MGIFDSIKSALGFGDDENTEETQAQESAEATEEPEALMNQEETSEEAPAEEAEATQEAEATEDSGMQMEVSDASETPVVDVVSKLEELSQNRPDLDWKSSIVDLMELLGLDSSYAHRKELAQELGIEDYHGTEEQNIALHKAVLQKLAENGGNIPEELLA
jgi:regulator of protease activity HflC (stomatin/prohibitin superfamily)